MSTFTGRQGKGAMRAHRDTKRAEAIERQRQFWTDVRRVEREQNVTVKTARSVVASSNRLRRRIEQRRGTTESAR